jgi:hypothetical protein
MWLLRSRELLAAAGLGAVARFAERLQVVRVEPQIAVAAVRNHVIDFYGRDGQA